MPFQVICPRCKQILVVPSKRAGSYANCPRCKGRLWVPETPPSEAGSAEPPVGQPTAASGEGNGSSAADAAAGRTSGGPAWTPPLAPGAPVPGLRASAMTAPPPRPLPATAPPTPPPPPAFAASAATGPARASLAPLVPVGKTARFISAESAASAIHPLADGKLPELQLEDAARTLVGTTKGNAISPLVLFAVLALSVALSMVAVLVDFNAPDATRLRRKNDARQRIEANFFPLVGEHGMAKAPERYQRYLAEAARAYSRGDRPTERWMYNRVLDLLRTERDKFQRGLTGSRERDKELEESIVVLLSDD